MSDVVFVLGAGASRDCGGPLMAEFLDVAADLLRAGRVDKHRDDYARVSHAIGMLQRVHSKAQLDLNNIESVFTALELGKVIRTVPGMDMKQIDEAIGSLKQVIVTTLEETIQFRMDGPWPGAPRNYAKFAGLVKHICQQAVPPRQVSVVTFNYDVAVDVALHREGFTPNYALDPAPPPEPRIDVLKLHGSMNWAHCGDGIRPMQVKDYLTHYGLRDHSLPVGSFLKSFFNDHAQPRAEVGSLPVIVPPSWNKADYHQVLSQVWATAAKHLSEAESIFILGYSLPETDAFFRHLYALGSVGKSPLRRIQVFNPEEEGGGADRRFSGLLGPGALNRYLYRPVPFEPAVAEIKKLFPGRPTP